MLPHKELADEAEARFGRDAPIEKGEVGTCDRARPSEVLAFHFGDADRRSRLVAQPRINKSHLFLHYSSPRPSRLERPFW
jgi:hypothetical protein